MGSFRQEAAERTARGGHGAESAPISPRIALFYSMLCGFVAELGLFRQKAQTARHARSAEDGIAGAVSRNFVHDSKLYANSAELGSFRHLGHGSGGPSISDGAASQFA